MKPRALMPLSVKPLTIPGKALVAAIRLAIIIPAIFLLNGLLLRGVLRLDTMIEPNAPSIAYLGISVIGKKAANFGPLSAPALSVRRMGDAAAFAPGAGAATFHTSVL